MEVADGTLRQFGMATIAMQAKEDAVRTGIGPSPLACAALTARHQGVRHDTVADAPPRGIDIRANRLNHPGKLVPHDQRRLPARTLGHHAFEFGPADASPCDADQDLIAFRCARYGNRHLLHDPRCRQHHRLHRAHRQLSCLIANRAIQIRRDRSPRCMHRKRTVSSHTPPVDQPRTELSALPRPTPVPER